MFLGLADLSSTLRRAKQRIFRNRNIPRVLLVMTRKARQKLRSHNPLKLVLLITACFCLVGIFFFLPLLLMSLKESSSMAVVELSCPSCSCHCSSETKPISPPFDCSKADPETYKEMKKDRVALLKEEIELKKQVMNDTMEHKNSQITDTKKSSSRFQNEAEKCNLGTAVCEAARERAMAELVEERRITSLWKKRARKLGWKNSPKVYTN